MNMCLIYAPAFALLAAALGRRGHYGQSRAMWWMAGGLAMLAPFIHWGMDPTLWGSMIWTAVAVEFTGMAERRQIPRKVTLLGYALMASYVLNAIDSFSMLPIAHVPTWISAGIGVSIAALLSGPLAHDIARHIASRVDRMRTRRFLRHAFCGRRGLADRGAVRPSPRASVVGGSETEGAR